MIPSVRLLRITPEPVRMMAVAARLCYTKGMTLEDVDRGLSDGECAALVGRVLASRHMSVLEHAGASFGVEGVSRNFSHQLVRHRNTSFEQQSLHFATAGDDMEVAAPAGLTDAQKARREELRRQAFSVYKEEIAEGVPKEEARHNLPSGIETRIVMTANVRQWMHFVEVRACRVNCQEILVVAMRVKKLLEDAMPILRPHLGPTCWASGACYEGKKMCEAPWKDACMVSGIGVESPYLWARPRKAESCGLCGTPDACCDGDCAEAAVAPQNEGH